MSEENTTPEPIETITDKSVKADAKTTPTPKIIQKHGGIGFFTALLMSTTSMVGGAYLALFINARPDVAQTLKIDALLPKAVAVNSDTSAIKNELEALKKDLASLAVKSSLANNAQVAQQAPQVAPNKLGEVKSQNAEATQIAPNPQANIAPANPPQQVANLEPLKAEISGLSGRLTAIETRLAALDPTGTGGAIIAAMQADIATLKVNFDNLTTKVAQTPSPAITFAVMSLAEAANNAGSFIPQFEAMKAAMPNSPEILALEPLARTGAPTRALLEKEFAALEQYIGQNPKSVKQEGGLTGWFRNLLSSLIKVEVKEEKPDPNSDAAIFERAKLKIGGSDIQGAINELEAMKNKTPEVTKWLESAKSRVELEGKIAALRGAVERGFTVSPVSQMGANGNQTAPINAATNAPMVALPNAVPQNAVPKVFDKPMNDNATNQVKEAR